MQDYRIKFTLEILDSRADDCSIPVGEITVTASEETFATNMARGLTPVFDEVDIFNIAGFDPEEWGVDIEVIESDKTTVVQKALEVCNCRDDDWRELDKKAEQLRQQAEQLK